MSQAAAFENVLIQWIWRSVCDWHTTRSSNAQRNRSETGSIKSLELRAATASKCTFVQATEATEVVRRIGETCAKLRYCERYIREQLVFIAAIHFQTQWLDTDGLRACSAVSYNKSTNDWWCLVASHRGTNRQQKWRSHEWRQVSVSEHKIFLRQPACSKKYAKYWIQRIPAASIRINSA